MKIWKLWSARTIPALLAGSMMLAGCAAGSGSAGSAAQQVHRMPNGDIQETTASVKMMPAFLAGKPSQMVDIYQLAAENADLLQWIPCYCGCAESAGHRSNQDCFVQSVGKDGSIIWDDHGTRCNVCMNIAATAIKMKQEGKSVKEIRNYIDQTYSKGYAPPTKTPMPL